MFLRYIKEKTAVNLNNFDFIRIKTDHSKQHQKYHVEAVKLFNEITTETKGLVHSSGKAVLIIKKFETEEEAVTFYESLEYAYINGRTQIFDVE